MDKIIYGGDTETHRGEPMTLQFYSEDIPCDDIFWVSPRDALRTFLKWCAKRRRNVAHVVYIHNLAFDLPELLYGEHAKLVESSDFEFTVSDWQISGVFGAPTFCRITNGHDITILLVDSYSFFRESLADAGARACPHLPKLPRPQGLGEKKFTARDKRFVEYAMRDAVVGYHLGVSIEEMHREFGIRQSVSVADMAAKIFRHRYLDYTIPQPTREIVDAAFQSYHGGKNNVTVAAGWYPDTTSLDLKSAYPDALSRMPAFSNRRLYKRFKGGRVRSVPDYGVYRISGTVADCDWPCLFSHSFKPLSGEVRGVWVQGFEVNEAIRSGEFKPTSVRGFYYDRDKDNQAPAFRHFMQDFFHRKETAKSKTMRTLFKLLPNSISGKLIQTRKSGTCALTDIDSGVTTSAADLVAGGMFHPFIASACTADPRARMHRIEHKYRAMHTATDGILTQSRVSYGRNLDVQPSKSGQLGTLAVEATGCTLLLIRGKCYVLYGKDGERPSQVFKGKRIVKYALHGFQGSVTQLERLVASNRRKYTVKRANTLKESIKRGLQVNDFVDREYTLKVGPIPVHERKRK